MLRGGCYPDSSIHVYQPLCSSGTSCSTYEHLIACVECENTHMIILKEHRDVGLGISHSHPHSCTFFLHLPSPVHCVFIVIVVGVGWFKSSSLRLCLLSRCFNSCRWNSEMPVQPLDNSLVIALPLECSSWNLNSLIKVPFIKEFSFQEQSRPIRTGLGVFCFKQAGMLFLMNFPTISIFLKISLSHWILLKEVNQSPKGERAKCTLRPHCAGFNVFILVDLTNNQ